MKQASLLFAASLLLLSCHKDDKSIDKVALTTGSWKLTAERTDYDKDGTYEEDSYAILAGCEKDNFYTFHEDGTVVKDEGPTKCISSNPQTSSFSWSSDGNHLKFGSTNYLVEELTTTTMRLSGTVSYNIIYTINVKMTYTKQ